MDDKDKSDLAHSLGMTRAEFDKNLEDIKQYLTLKEREARRNGLTTIENISKKD